jgi:CheY-like chemotaxis protein
METKRDITTRQKVHRAVIVGDEPLEAAEQVLAGLGFEVVGTATSVEAALSLIEQWRPDLLVVDVNATDADRGVGLECLMRARAQSAPDLKAIAIGDSADQTLIDAAFAAGADAFVVAPDKP